MLDKKMLNIREVLELVDLKMGYGIDGYSQQVFEELNKEDKKMYLVPSKAMRRYMESYIIRKFKENNGGREPKSDEEFNSIIYMEGEGKGRRYAKEGILLLLEDEKIKEKVQERLYESCYLFENNAGEYTIIPNFVWEYYNEKVNGRFKDIEKAKYFTEIKDDPTDTLKMKLFIIQQEIENRETFEKMIEEFDEVTSSRSPESLYSWMDETD